MTHKWKRWVAPGAAITAAAMLAACSSSSSSSSSTTPTASSSTSASASTSASTNAGVAKAQQMVSQYEATTTSYPVPTASIKGVSALKGKTVYYIPLVAAIPGFVVTAATMKTALATVGVKVQVCDPQGQPQNMASCAQQATTAKAAAIVTDAIPYAAAQNAFDAAKKAGVPIIIADQIPPTGAAANNNQLTYVPGVINQPSQIFWWMIADSQGKANSIIAQESDSPSSIAYVQDGLSIFTANCPGCTTTVKRITATTNSTLASATSANLLANSNATYYYTEFEDSLDPTVQGIAQANKSSAVKLSVAGGSVDGLGRLASGTGPVKAVVAVDQAFAGWALSDEVLRMATKSGPVTETFPSRLFTAQNIGSIKVSTAEQASGAWFGNTSYQSAFKTLWGV